MTESRVAVQLRSTSVRFPLAVEEVMAAVGANKGVANAAVKFGVLVRGGGTTAEVTIGVMGRGGKATAGITFRVLGSIGEATATGITD